MQEGVILQNKTINQPIFLPNGKKEANKLLLLWFITEIGRRLAY